MTNPTRIEVCADKSCENWNVAREIELTDAEVADLEVQAAQAQADRIAREAEEQALAALKASARAKLIAGQPLTEEEAATIVL